MSSENRASLIAPKIVAARMRALWLALRGASVGGKVGIASRCEFLYPAGITVGGRTSIERSVYMKLVSPAARLSIGACSFVGYGAEFDVMSEVKIGAHTLIAPHCFITDHTHGIKPGARIDEQPCVAFPVSIGSDVWLGYGVVVLPGVTIGDGAVIGANSVVTRDVDSMSVFAGVPARKISDR